MVNKSRAPILRDTPLCKKSKLTYLEGAKMQLKSEHTPKSTSSSKHYGVEMVLQVRLSSTNVAFTALACE